MAHTAHKALTAALLAALMLTGGARPLTARHTTINPAATVQA